jgi:hypothetical protein
MNGNWWVSQLSVMIHICSYIRGNRRDTRYMMYNLRFLEWYTVLLPHSLVHCGDLWDNGAVEHKANGYFIIETSQNLIKG